MIFHWYEGRRSSAGDRTYPNTCISNPLWPGQKVFSTTPFFVQHILSDRINSHYCPGREHTASMELLLAALELGKNRNWMRFFLWWFKIWCWRPSTPLIHGIRTRERESERWGIEIDTRPHPPNKKGVRYKYAPNTTLKILTQCNLICVAGQLRSLHSESLQGTNIQSNKLFLITLSYMTVVYCLDKYSCCCCPRFLSKLKDPLIMARY